MLIERKKAAWEAMQQKRKIAQLDASEPHAAATGGGDGDGGGMSVSMKDYVDSRDDAVRSGIHAEFADLRADIARLPSTWTLIGTALAIVSILIAVLAFGGARFSAGISLADQRQEQLQRDAAQDAAAKRSEAKLDAILSKVSQTDTANISQAGK